MKLLVLVMLFERKEDALLLRLDGAEEDATNDDDVATNGVSLDAHVRDKLSLATDDDVAVAPTDDSSVADSSAVNDSVTNDSSVFDSVATGGTAPMDGKDDSNVSNDSSSML